MHNKAEISIAPMMGYTDRHFRVLARYVAPKAKLYTQMLVADALYHNQGLTSFFGCDNRLGNVVLQLGGSQLPSLLHAAQLAEASGYSAINLNIGCPSHKVKLAGIGACLLKSPTRVADCVAALIDAVSIPITVKTRIGVDELDSREFIIDWINQVSAAGCKHFVFHARKAWLSGLNPKQNRTVPALNYDRVREIQKAFPKLKIGINGGITDLETAFAFAQEFDEVMIGRYAYKSLQLIAQLSNSVQNYVPMQSALIRYVEYMSAQKSDVPLHHMLKHCMSLYYHMPLAKCWRSTLAKIMAENQFKSTTELIELSGECDRIMLAMTNPA